EPRQVRQRIDRAGRRCPACPDHHEGREPPSTILGDSSGEIAEIHPEMVVYRDRADRTAPESSHVRDLVERVMGFARDVYRRRCREAPEPVLAIVRER